MRNSNSQQASRLKGDFVPSSYEEMFSYYYEYVVKLVQTYGVDYQSAEDVAMTILAKFIEKDALEDFKPEFTSEFGGVVRKAVFRTFLSGFVIAYVRHHRDMINLRKHREGFSTDTPMFFFTDSGDPVTWMDYVGPHYVEEHEDLMAQDMIRQIREQVATAIPRNAQDLCNLPVFFEAVIEQTEARGKVDISELATQFGVSKTSIQNWLQRLREEIRIAIEVG